MVEVRRAAPDDWQAIRAARLDALRDAPNAFGSTLARERLFGEEKWRERVLRDAWFLAGHDEGTVGIAAVMASDEAPQEMELVAMWVSPAARGHGVGDALVTTACAEALVRGARTVSLWVTDDNTPARQLYERNGFRATDERQPLPGNPSVGEQRMRLSLGASPRTPGGADGS